MKACHRAMRQLDCARPDGTEATQDHTKRQDNRATRPANRQGGRTGTVLKCIPLGQGGRADTHLPSCLTEVVT